MVMPSSGPISMAQAHAEFGRGYSLSAYYGCAPGVPTSGIISLSDLYGKSNIPSFQFWKIYNIVTSGNYNTPTINEVEFRTVAGGADYTDTCVDCSTINSSSGGVGRTTITDNQLITGLSFWGAPAFFTIRLTAAAPIRQIALCGLGASGQTASFKVGAANTQAELTGANNGTLMGSFSGVPWTSNSFTTVNL